MTALLRGLLQLLLPYLVEISARLLAIQVGLGKAAIESRPGVIEDTAYEAFLNSEIILSDLVTVNGKLDTIIAALPGLDTDVLAAIAALPAGSALPDPFPLPGDTWAALLEGTPYSAGYLMTVAASLPWQLRNGGVFPLTMAPAFGVFANWAEFDQDRDLSIVPSPDWADIRVDDTRLTWLQRTDGVMTWVANGQNGDPIGTPTITYPVLTDFQVVCLFTEADFQRWAGGGLRQRAAPVWPGLAAVTLGTPVALSSDLTVAGPLDGLIVSITTPPAALGKFAFGGFTAYYKVGEISFISDNGDAEPWQYLAFDQAIYCPKAMNRAASASLRVLAGAAGLATPWVVT